jgi:hypothetical protein
MDDQDPPIRSQEAAIQTATVEVKTLTLKGRQLTLSVFRQIVVEPILVHADGEIKLAGTPWGRVHYFPPPCDKKGGDHLHIIWQKGGELRRACVDPVVAADLWQPLVHTTYAHELEYYGREWDAWLALWMIRNWKKRPDRAPSGSSAAAGCRYALGKVVEKERSLAAGHPISHSDYYESDHTFWKAVGLPGAVSTFADAQAGLEGRLNAEEEGWSSGPMIGDDVESIRRRERDHARLYQSLLTDISQLFIAV